MVIRAGTLLGWSTKLCRPVSLSVPSGSGSQSPEGGRSLLAMKLNRPSSSSGRECTSISPWDT